MGEDQKQPFQLSFNRFLLVSFQESKVTSNGGLILVRRLVLPQRIEKCSLTSLQQRLVKTCGRPIKHARFYWLLLAESHLTWRLFASVLGRIDALPLPSG